MNISDRTLDVLSNFASINQSILIREGNELTTIAASKNLLAETTMEENFGRDVGIYDLTKFLGVLRLYKERDFDFSEEFVTIFNEKNRKQYTKFYYSDASVIVTPPTGKSIAFPDEDIVTTFDITSKDLQTIIKGCSIMTLPEVSIVGGGGEPIRVSGVDINNSAMGSFNHELEQNADDTFEFVIALENLIKLMHGDYQIAFLNSGISRFINTSVDIKYYVAVNANNDNTT